MINFKKHLRTALTTAMVGGVMLAAAPANAALVNVIPGNWSLLSWPGTIGVLRAGSPWGPGSTPSSVLNVVNGAFQPEGTQWNNGSMWWDEDPSVNAAPITLTIQMNQVYNFKQFVMQADDNDGYALDYWNGSAWQLAWDFGAKPSYGLVTRDPALVNISTDRLRIRAYGGDAYYAVSELQGFVNSGVPEPAAWAMMLGGFGLAGVAMRRSRRVRATA